MSWLERQQAKDRERNAKREREWKIKNDKECRDELIAVCWWFGPGLIAMGILFLFCGPGSLSSGIIMILIGAIGTMGLVNLLGGKTKEEYEAGIAAERQKHETSLVAKQNEIALKQQERFSEVQVGVAAVREVTRLPHTESETVVAVGPSGTNVSHIQRSNMIDAATARNIDADTEKKKAEAELIRAQAEAVKRQAKSSRIVDPPSEGSGGRRW